MDHTMFSETFLQRGSSGHLCKAVEGHIPSQIAFIDRILGISPPAAASLSASVAKRAPTQPITGEYYAKRCVVNQWKVS